MLLDLPVLFVWLWPDGLLLIQLYIVWGLQFR